MPASLEANTFPLCQGFAHLFLSITTNHQLPQAPKDTNIHAGMQVKLVAFSIIALLASGGLAQTIRPRWPCQRSREFRGRKLRAQLRKPEPGGSADTFHEIKLVARVLGQVKEKNKAIDRLDVGSYLTHSRIKGRFFFFSFSSCPLLPASIPVWPPPIRRKQRILNTPTPFLPSISPPPRTIPDSFPVPWPELPEPEQAVRVEDVVGNQQGKADDRN